MYCVSHCLHTTNQQIQTTMQLQHTNRSILPVANTCFTNMSFYLVLLFYMYEHSQNKLRHPKTFRNRSGKIAKLRKKVTCKPVNKNPSRKYYKKTKIQKDIWVNQSKKMQLWNKQIGLNVLTSQQKPFSEHANLFCIFVFCIHFVVAQCQPKN